MTLLGAVLIVGLKLLELPVLGGKGVRLDPALRHEVKVGRPICAVRTLGPGPGGGAESCEAGIRDRTRRKTGLLARVVGVIGVELALGQILAPPRLLILAVAQEILDGR